MASQAIDTKIICTECVKVVKIVDELRDDYIDNKTRLWLRCHDLNHFVFLEKTAGNVWPERAILEQLRVVNSTQILYDGLFKSLIKHARDYNFLRRLVVSNNERTLPSEWGSHGENRRNEIKFEIETLLDNLVSLLKEMK